jgi:hypothetical protein
MRVAKKYVLVISIVAALLTGAVAASFVSPSYAVGAVKVSAPKSVKVMAAKAKSLKVTWKKVKGADGYIIYMAKKNMATGKLGKYKRVKTVRNGKVTNYTKKRLKAGTKYHFKLKAYNGKTKSKYTKSKSAYARRSGPAITKIAPLSNCGAVFEFKPVKGAISYQVQTRTGKNGKWEDNASIGGRMVKPKASISLSEKNGKTMYVRMGVVTKIGKVTLHSVWGKPKAVKIPKKSKYETEYDDPNFYLDDPVSYKKGQLPLDGQLWDGAIGKYLSIGEDGKRASMLSAFIDMRWPDRNIHTHAGTRIKVVDPSCVVIWTVDGTEPSLTNGTKVTQADGAVWIWQDRNSVTVKARGYVNNKEKFYATTTNGSLMYYGRLKKDLGIMPGPAALFDTDGYYTASNPRPPYHEKDITFRN